MDITVTDCIPSRLTYICEMKISSLGQGRAILSELFNDFSQFLQASDGGASN
jgi:hypothetical protein